MLKYLYMPEMKPPQINRVLQKHEIKLSGKKLEIYNLLGEKDFYIWNQVNLMGGG